MRVRLYELGARSAAVVFHIDNFPATLNLTDSGEVTHRPMPGRPVCRLEDIGGQILFRAVASDDPVAHVNEAPLESGPLMPGDRLLVGERKYLVSYERTSGSPPPESRFRLSG